MYYVAKVDTDKCADYKCTMCTLHCPEANTLMFDRDSNASFVVADRCKGCALCVYVCSDLLNRDCIVMTQPEKEN